MSGLIYLDTSAVIKRVFLEEESIALRDAITDAVEAGGRFATSVLTLVEVSRGVRGRVEKESLSALHQAIARSTDDAAIAPIDERTVESARVIGPPVLRSLDAIHLATAVALGADELWTYDERLAEASVEMGIPVRMPGRATDRDA